MNPYIKTLIETNKNAVNNVTVLEKTIAAYPVIDEKSKANYGNLCVALRGYRMVEDATEAMLINEHCLKDDNGDFYIKVEDDNKSDEDMCTFPPKSKDNQSDEDNKKQ